ncbi:MAG: membrane integrity-associated transporter subunit PqiC [Burkholderiales bacterium]
MNVGLRHAAGALPWLLAGALSACGSPPPTHFHSLVATPASTGNAAHVAPASDVRFEVLPVAVPAQVDVPQFVVRLSDGSMAVLEQERWIAPLGDEIRTAVALRVGQALADAPRSNHAASAGVWGIGLEVQRFDSVMGRAVGVQLQWSLQPASGAAVLRCQARYEEPVGTGASALAAGYRAVFERLGDAIGRALQVAAAGGTPACA